MTDFTLAGNGRGDRIAAWRDDRGIRFRLAFRGGRFGPSRLVRLSYRPEGVSAAMDGRGRVLLSWSLFDGERLPRFVDHDEGCCDRVAAAMISRAGRASAPRVLTARGSDARREGLVVTANGRMAFAWEQNSTVRIRLGVLGRGFGSVELLPQFGDVVGMNLTGGPPRVAMQLDGTAPDYEPLLEEFVRRPHTGFRLESMTPWDGGLFGVDGRGREVVARDHRRLDYSSTLEVGTRAPGAPLRVRALQRQTDGRSIEPLLSVAGSGAAGVAWNFGETDDRSQVWASLRAPGGGFRAPAIVYTSPVPWKGDATDISVAPDGSAALGILPFSTPGRGQVELLSSHGGVSSLHLLRDGAPVEAVRVLADDRGAAAVFISADGLTAIRTR